MGKAINNAMNDTSVYPMMFDLGDLGCFLHFIDTALTL